METEHWALLISFVALSVSIGVPIWQSQQSNAKEAANKRLLLLQKILTSKSMLWESMHNLIVLLDSYGDKMDEAQRSNLQGLIPRMREEHGELENLHEVWSDFDDGEPIQEIEKSITHMDSFYSEATDTAKVIENARKTYEDT